MSRGHRQVSDGEPASCASRSVAPGRDHEGDKSGVASMNNRSSIAKRPEKCAGQGETAGCEDAGRQFRGSDEEGSCSQEREKELDSGMLGEANLPTKPDLSSPGTSAGSQEHGMYSGEVSDDDEGQEEEDVLAAFVRRMGGSRVIRRILIANNGNAAVRVGADVIGLDFRGGRHLLSPCLRTPGESVWFATDANTATNGNGCASVYEASLLYVSRHLSVT